MPKTPDPRQFNAPAVAFDATPTSADGRMSAARRAQLQAKYPAFGDEPQATDRRKMTPARRRALLGHTAEGRALLAAEDARNGAPAVAHA
jgi:hypothetical protein